MATFIKLSQRKYKFSLKVIKILNKGISIYRLKYNLVSIF